ncbi:MAG: 6-phosphogluconolactonase [Spirochaetes bacterium]|nr:6-phosphogluconolactonase [Spirochaetota bacterium]
MNVIIRKTEKDMGKAAANDAAELLRYYTSVKKKNIVITFAAAPSQSAFLAALTREKGIDWSKVIAFHMDEYLDLPDGHPNTFKDFLNKQVVSRVPLHRKNVTFIKDMQASSKNLCREYGALFTKAVKSVRAKGGVYIVFMGIGVNGHIAFNEPGTNLWTKKPIVPVTIDATSVRQQYNDYKNDPNPKARYASLADVPRKAVTMSPAGLLDADRIFCIVPGPQKADAVKKTVESAISDKVPATLLRLHENVRLYIDGASAGKLLKKPSL